MNIFGYGSRVYKFYKPVHEFPSLQWVLQRRVSLILAEYNLIMGLVFTRIINYNSVVAVIFAISCITNFLILLDQKRLR